MSMHNSLMRAEQRNIEADSLIVDLKSQLAKADAEKARPDLNRNSQEQAVRTAEARAERAERDAERWQKELAETKARDVAPANSWVPKPAVVPMLQPVCCSPYAIVPMLQHL